MKETLYIIIGIKVCRGRKISILWLSIYHNADYNEQMHKPYDNMITTVDDLGDMPLWWWKETRQLLWYVPLSSISSVLYLFSNSLCYRNPKLRNIHHDGRRRSLVGWNSIFLRWLSARCLSFQLIKERPSSQILKDYVYYYLFRLPYAFWSSLLLSSSQHGPSTWVILQGQDMSDQAS